MRFDYYQRLTQREQAVYRASDRLSVVPLDRPRALTPLAVELQEALGRDDRIAVQEAAYQLCLGITQDLGIPEVIVEVLAVRPHQPTEELHGLYTWEVGHTPRIQVWMRTAKQQRVVAFRTFSRTLLHEVCHHIDYTLLELDESFHTRGFFRRESSLVRQLLPHAPRTRGISSRKPL